MDEACSFRDFECGSGRQVDAPSNGFINAVMAAPTNSCSRCQQYLRNGTTHQIGCNAPYKYISISFLAEQLANEMWQADGTLKTIRHSPSLLSIAEPCVQHPEKLTSHIFRRRSSLKLALSQRGTTYLTVKEFRFVRHVMLCVPANLGIPSGSQTYPPVHPLDRDRKSRVVPGSTWRLPCHALAG